MLPPPGSGCQPRAYRLSAIHGYPLCWTYLHEFLGPSKMRKPCTRFPGVGRDSHDERDGSRLGEIMYTIAAPSSPPAVIISQARS